MPSTPHVFAARTDDQLQRLQPILAEVFRSPVERLKQFMEDIGAGNFRLVEIDGALAGGLAIISMGQFFGGRSVPTAGIAAVGVSPEHRGRGAATALMRRTIVELHDAGIPLSALYPATQPLYRRAGYEQAGSLFQVTLPTASIALRQRELPLRPIREEDQEQVEALYRRRAAGGDGFLDRGPYIWKRVRRPRGEAARGLLVGDPADPQGYVYYVHRDSTDAAYSLEATDIVAVTPQAGRRLLMHFADHRSMTDTVKLSIPPTDPLLMLLTEQRYTLKLDTHWMVRIVHVPGALEARGYPVGLTAELPFHVDDDLVPANDGPFTLRVRDGRGEVTPGGPGRIRVDIRGLAALYSGHRSPADLVTAGHLSAPPADLSLLGSTFAGPAPAMVDIF